MLKIIIIAGEHSGDILGSKVMASIKKFYQGKIFFEGVGGPLMHKEGLCKNLIPFQDLSVMGIVEIIPKLTRLISHLSYLRKYIISSKPDILITIDSPDFNFRIVSKLKKYKFSKIHFVAPSVWAWRPGRAKKISKYYDHLFTLLPFEPKFFIKHGLSSSYIGNPVIESFKEGNQNFLSKQMNLKLDDKILLVLPGSRLNELKRMLPVYIHTSIIMMKKIDNLKVIYMVPEEYMNMTKKYLKNLNSISNDLPKVFSAKDKYDIFPSVDIALATSGTVSLELAISKIPSVIGYKMSFFTYFILKLLVRTEWISLPNIILNKLIYPEFIQNKCTSNNLYEAVSSLLLDEQKYQRQINEISKVKKELLVEDNLLDEYVPSIIVNEKSKYIVNEKSK
ncbi:MAG: lipid-A-disaccharide synthase [Rhodospirillaceae bacterium]|nr:lipid-A-disaccharide synthase [Rhodospirillaceae bacterium]|tara:strand:- start:10164 stop:11342 length:1179 start_codon:yes stop_codon:yes gene_type:complete